MGIVKAAFNGAADSIKSPLKVVKSLGKGNFSQAFKDLKHIPGNQERANSKTLRKAGIRGWAGKNPGAAVGAAFATFFGGAALMGGGAAAGGGAAGAGGAAGGGAAGAGGGAAASSGGGGLMSSVTSMFSGGGSGASGAAGSGGGGMLSGFSNWMGGSSGGMSNSGMANAGMSMFSSLTNFLTAKSQAKAQKAAQEAQWKEQLKATREAYRQLGEAGTASNKQYHADTLNNQVSLLQQQAQVELLAGASGTGGQSISSMLEDLTAQGGRNQANILDNYETEQLNFSNQINAIRTGNQMVQRQFNKPSAFGAFANGISNAASSYVSGAQTGKDFSTAFNNSRTYSSGSSSIGG